jgi:hypothetical protein
VEGLHVILLVAIALLKVLKTHFLEKNFEEILEFLKTFKQDDIDHADGDLIGQLLLKQAELLQEGSAQKAILDAVKAGTIDEADFEEPRSTSESDFSIIPQLAGIFKWDTSPNGPSFFSY